MPKYRINWCFWHGFADWKKRFAELIENIEETILVINSANRILSVGESMPKTSIDLVFWHQISLSWRRFNIKFESSLRKFRQAKLKYHNSMNVLLSTQKTRTLFLNLFTFRFDYTTKTHGLEVFRNFWKMSILKESKQCSHFQDPMPCFCFGISRSNV